MRVEELSQSLKQFGTLDQIVFGSMLCGCSLVGLYFGLKEVKRRQSAKNEEDDTIHFLMGGRKMMVFPVAMSLIASLVSGVLLLGKKEPLNELKKVKK